MVVPLDTAGISLAPPPHKRLSALPFVGYGRSGRKLFEVGNGRLSIGANHAFLTIGLPTFIRGSNLDPLTDDEYTEAIDRLSEMLGVSVWEGNACRFDVAWTMRMHYPPSDYYDHLGAAADYQRVDWDGQSLLYVQQWRSIEFYDKEIQLRGLNVVVPKDVQGQNLLRVEVRIKKRAKAQFGRSFAMRHFLNEDDRRVIRDFVLREFRKITLIGSGYAPATNAREWDRQIIRGGVEALGGSIEAEKKLRDLYARGGMTWSKFDKRRTRVREAFPPTHHDHATEVAERFVTWVDSAFYKD